MSTEQVLTLSATEVLLDAGQRRATGEKWSRSIRSPATFRAR